MSREADPVGIGQKIVRRARTWRFRLLVRWLLVVLLLTVYAQLIAVKAGDPTTSDFGKFYASARFLLEGQDIYAPVSYNWNGDSPEEITRTGEPIHPNLNPPFQTLLFAPLGQLSYRMAYWVWSILSLGAGLAAAALMARGQALTPGVPRRALNLSILLLAQLPTLSSVLLGHFSLVLLLILTVAWLKGRNGDDRGFGIALGVAASIKIFAGLFLVYLLVRRQWKAAVWMAATLMVCALIALSAVGFDTYRHYATNLSAVAWYSDDRNASFAGFFTRALGASKMEPWGSTPQLAQLLTLLASLLALGCMIWLAWPRHRPESRPGFDLSFSFALVVMLLVSPLGWMYYFPVLLIAVTVAGYYAKESGAGIVAAGIIIGWVLSSIPGTLDPASEIAGPERSFIWASLYFYALLVWGATLLYLSRRRSSKAC